MLKKSPKKKCDYCQVDISNTEVKQRFCNSSCRQHYNIQQSNKKYVEKVDKPYRSKNSQFTKLWASCDIPKIKP